MSISPTKYSFAGRSPTSRNAPTIPEFYIRNTEGSTGSSQSHKALNALGLSNREGSNVRKHRRGSRDSRDSLLPPGNKTRLNGLFKEIEKEFEQMYLENVKLKEQIHALEKANPDREKTEDDCDGFDKNVIKSFTKKNFPKTRHKLKAQTNKIVSSFKTSNIACSFVKEYKGHRDGIWDVAVSNLSNPLIATASADRTAKIWGVDSGKCLLNYVGHQGSVNSIRFHPAQDLVITGSGDGTAHVWKASALPDATGLRIHSSEESAESSDDGGEVSGDDVLRSRSLTQAAVVLTGHQGVVVSADWLTGGEQVVTASWDRTASLYDVSTQTLLHSLAGHDMELTGAACHPTQRLVSTSSNDTTFRLWDFREAIHSVSVFQGHTDAVTCTAFSRSEHIVSGSDDRTVKVWDLRNMRAPLTNIQTDSQVNKLSINGNGMIAIPQDNRHVLIYDVSGNKLARLPRESRKCHMRMVSAVAWSGENETNWRTQANLFSAGFDRLALGWRVKGKEEGAGSSKVRNKEGSY